MFSLARTTSGWVAAVRLVAESSPAASHCGNKEVVHDAEGRLRDSRGQVAGKAVEARGEKIASKKRSSLDIINIMPAKFSNIIRNQVAAIQRGGGGIVCISLSTFVRRQLQQLE